MQCNSHYPSGAEKNGVQIPKTQAPGASRSKACSWYDLPRSQKPASSAATTFSREHGTQPAILSSMVQRLNLLDSSIENLSDDFAAQLSDTNKGLTAVAHTCEL